MKNINGFLFDGIDFLIDALTSVPGGIRADISCSGRWKGRTTTSAMRSLVISVGERVGVKVGWGEERTRARQEVQILIRGNQNSGSERMRVCYRGR